jgi:FtsZ-interacting cell division protein ZipA
VIVIVGVIAIVALLVFLVMHRKQNAAKSSH